MSGSRIVAILAKVFLVPVLYWHNGGWVAFAFGLLALEFELLLVLLRSERRKGKV